MDLRTRGEKIYAVFNYILLTIFGFIFLYPMWHILMASVSDPALLLADRGFYFWFKGSPSLRGYQLVLENPNIINGYINTMFIVIVGTLISIVVTTLGAYSLSRKGCYWNSKIMKMIVFTMYFHGGLLPFYILVRNLGLLDNLWALILPVSVSTWNLIILRTAFHSVPDSLIESAKLDGANDFRVVWQIVVPVSKAAVSVIILFYAVGYWNAWFNAAIFITDRTLWPLQLVLREILILNNANMMVNVGGVGQQGIERYRILVRYCTIIIATLPILLIYPFIQKYFVSGVMIGSLKE